MDDMTEGKPSVNDSPSTSMSLSPRPHEPLRLIWYAKRTVLNSATKGDWLRTRKRRRAYYFDCRFYNFLISKLRNEFSPKFIQYLLLEFTR